MVIMVIVMPYTHLRPVSLFLLIHVELYMYVSIIDKGQMKIVNRPTPTSNVAYTPSNIGYSIKYRLTSNKHNTIHQYQ